MNNAYYVVENGEITCINLNLVTRFRTGSYSDKHTLSFDQMDGKTININFDTKELRDAEVQRLISPMNETSRDTKNEKTINV